ncbi:energy transducer TonB [Erythrobacter sp. GH1-10]|uniref:energy transducer TonB n=1 Tax=Erythrobacter sp. GH1-10 TaxID=3349334 RepID=UPI003878093C
MNTNTKIPALFVRRAIGAAILLAVPAGALASGDGDDIIVRSQPAMDKWQAETTQDLSRYLRGGPVSSRARPNNAIVQVSFSVDEEGKPENVALFQSGGNWAANHMALRAVRRLKNLSEVPVSNPREVEFLANIIFADTDDHYERLSARLEQSESERIASSGRARTYIALRN